MSNQNQVVKTSPLIEESHFIEFKNGKLHLKRFYIQKTGIPIFMLHGNIENGKIFYSDSKKGLAPFLARAGYDVFVGDLRGKGKSTPKISKQVDVSLTETITEDIHWFVQKIQSIKGDVPQFWASHSWGGTLQYAYLLRYPNQVKVNAMVHFGVKRRITVQNFSRFFMLDVGWKFLGNLLIPFYGYMPAKDLRFGAENEPKTFFYQTNQWFKSKNWIDPDGFNYGEQIKKVNLPPALFFNGAKDTVLGAPKDTKLFIESIQQGDNATFQLLSRANKNTLDYGHIDILTSKHAEQDHFQQVLTWLKPYE